MRVMNVGMVIRSGREGGDESSLTAFGAVKYEIKGCCTVLL